MMFSGISEFRSAAEHPGSTSDDTSAGIPAAVVADGLHSGCHTARFHGCCANGYRTAWYAATFYASVQYEPAR